MWPRRRKYSTRLQRSGACGQARRDEQDYAVDHAIPFSLWHCNALWNLLPSDEQVNGSKSKRHRRRFDYELTEFTGDRVTERNWEDAAFQRLVEAVMMGGSAFSAGCGRPD